MGTKTGELRETLIDAIHLVRTGEMKPDQAKAIAMLAGQVNLSLQVEINMLRESTMASVGLTQLGDEQQPKALTLLPEPQPITGQARLIKGHAQSGSK